jgi:hypothetical protein
MSSNFWRPVAKVAIYFRLRLETNEDSFMKHGGSVECVRHKA